MCEPSSWVALAGAVIGAATSAATAANSNSQQKKAAARQREAEEEMHRKSLQQKESVAKTAQTPSVNDNLNKRTLSSLKIPTAKAQSTKTINISDTNVGLNIPM